MGPGLPFPASALGPPDWSARLAIVDVDEANHYQTANATYGSVSRKNVGRGDLRLRTSTVCVGRVPIRWSTTGVGQLIRANTTVPLVQIPLTGPLTYRVGQRTLEVWPGQVAFVRTGVQYIAGYDSEVTILSMVPSAFALEVELGAAGARVLESGAQPVQALDDGKAMSRLGVILGAIRMAPPLGPDDPLALDAETRMTAWLADLLGRERNASIPGRVASARLQRVEDWIDAQLAEPVSLGQLARVAGLEASSLRKGFRRRRNMTPLQWLWSQRMAAARMKLTDAGPDDTVIRIAHDCGLNHAGRFSIDYRKRYGELPSRTLYRAQMKA